MNGSLTIWNSIQSGQRWMTENGSTSIGNRGNFAICQLFQGTYSLACSITAINDAIHRDFSGKMLSELERTQLVALRLKMQEKVEKHQASHSILYTLFMRILGRSTHSAYTCFVQTYNAVLDYDKQEKKKAKIKEVASPIEPSCAVDGKYIPIDQTSTLEPLLQSDFYIGAHNQHKLQMLCCFVHLYPLCHYLNRDIKDLVEVMRGVVPGTTDYDRRHEYIISVAIRFVEQHAQSAIPAEEISLEKCHEPERFFGAPKANPTVGYAMQATKRTSFARSESSHSGSFLQRNLSAGIADAQLTWSRDWENIAKILYKSKIGSYVYHGTNQISFMSIMKHGLGQAKRDYDPNTLQDIFNRCGRKFEYTSAAKTDRFYVAGKPTTAFIYGNVSPEWLPSLGNSMDPAAIQIRQLYRESEHFALIQIKRIDQAVPPSVFVRWVKGIKSGKVCQDAFIKRVIFFDNDNLSLSNADFQAASVQSFTLPKFSEIET